MTGNVQNLTVEEALNYYSKLLIIQYATLPKATATIECLCNCSVVDGLIFALQNAFILGTAVGDQLTIIGKIVGVPRQIYGLDLTDTFFNFSDWRTGPSGTGFNDWNNPVTGIRWASWLTTAIYTPTDFEMLALIQLKIMRNNYYPSLGVIVPALYNVFGNAINLNDNFNTSITYNFQQPYFNVAAICKFLGNILPKPMGVAISINQVGNILTDTSGNILTDTSGNILYDSVVTL